MEPIEETLEISTIKEVNIALLRNRNFSHPVRPASSFAWHTESAPIAPSQNFIHTNPVRRLVWLDVQGVRTLEGPILAAYCEPCQTLFYAYDTEQSVAEVDELERVYALTSM